MAKGTCALCGVITELRIDIDLCEDAEACIQHVRPSTTLNAWAQEASSLGEVLAALDVTIERAEKGALSEVVAALQMIREAVQSLATNAAERAAGRG